MTANTQVEPQLQNISLGCLFLIFLRFGFLAFGGPIAQIAMIREELVEKQSWISSARFNRLLAVMQALPGPEAHEICVHLGIVARGRIGGILAGLGFMLPGFLLMLLAAWGYAQWIAGRAEFAAALLGIQIVVIAIIVRALEKIGRHVLEDGLLIALAIGAAVATLFGVPFWLPLLVAGLAYAVASHRMALALVLIVGLGLSAALVLLGNDTQPSAVTSTASAATTLGLFIAGLKGGLLTFGGAYTAIPYVRADTVGRGWLSDGSFLDGVGVAGVLPAPLVIFATFAGYIAGGWAGALAITAGMFLPAFAFSLIFFERLEAIMEAPALHRLLSGVAAAAVGIIAATAITLGQGTVERAPSLLPTALIFGIALVLAWRLKGAWVAPVLIGAGAVAGGLLL